MRRTKKIVEVSFTIPSAPPSEVGCHGIDFLAFAVILPLARLDSHQFSGDWVRIDDSKVRERSPVAMPIARSELLAYQALQSLEF